jgi:hypothetical protein
MLINWHHKITDARSIFRQIGLLPGAISEHLDFQTPPSMVFTTELFHFSMVIAFGEPD